MSIDPIHLVLPLPPSVNAYLGHSRFGVYLTKAGREFNELVAAAVAQQLPGHRPLDGPLHIDMVVWLKDWRSDEDNRVKPARDALEHAGVLANDRQFCTSSCKRYYDKAFPRAEVIISEETDPEAIAVWQMGPDA